MKYIDEFRDGEKAKPLIEEIRRTADRPLRIMEVCGTHTVSIARYGIRKVLPPSIELVSGPGCPVCVTANRDLDRAISLAQIPKAVVLTFGDMVRVPGSFSSLARERATGKDVRVVYSPLDGLQMAEKDRDRPYIFLGVGFETTAPAVAATLLEARKRNVKNFFVFSAHKTVPHALRVLLNAGEMKLDGFLMPGHVSAIIGSRPYEFLPQDFGLAAVISGFEPIDILQSILLLIRQVKNRRPRVEIQYRRGVLPQGNPHAVEVMGRVFQPIDAEWRGLGCIPQSGLALSADFSSFDAGLKFDLSVPEPREAEGCRCGEVLRGILRPAECALFSEVCSPQNPVGPCMVSFEGSCAAAYKYGT
jgi:hydrogenase expression/formation protein HypD